MTTTTKRKPKMSAAAALKTYEKARAAAPLLSREQVFDISDTMSAPTTHAPLRLALAMLSADQRKLFDTIATDKATAIEAAASDAQLQDYEIRLLYLYKMVNTARASLALALSWRPDMEAAVAEARS